MLRRVANKPRVERTQRLEGSRFVARQLYGLVRSRLPGTSQGVAVLYAGCIRRRFFYFPSKYSASEIE
ncbi:MAG TPA: hypothetical protein VN939_09290, partial [Chthoniobacterales bacterium]|nr:hypothetical protein [Chthoniobacterales bacterium]